MAEIRRASVEAIRVQDDLRTTTEQAVRATKLGIVKQQEDTRDRFATLRQQLGNEFADARIKMEAMSTAFATSEAQLKELLQEASDQQIVMKIEATQSLSDSEVQGEVLKDLPIAWM